MKKTTYILSLLFVVLNSNAQKIKTGSYEFKYESLPVYELPETYKTYKVTILNNATDGVPLDPNKNSRIYQYLATSKLDNITKAGSLYVEQGLEGNPSTGFNGKPDEISDIELVFTYGDIEFIDKSDLFTKVIGKNEQAGTYVNSFNYKLTFKFPYHIKIVDRKKKTIVCDTLIDNLRTMLYPEDYYIDAFGKKLKPYGALTIDELKLDYTKNTADILTKSKSALQSISTAEQREFSTLYLFNNVLDHSFRYIRIKTKDPIFDICDTASNLVKIITEAIDLNAKNQKHLNWHTIEIKNNVEKLNVIWSSMLTDNKYLSQITEADDLAEYKHGLKFNLISVNLMLDNFAKAQELFDEVKSTKTYLNKRFLQHDDYMKEIGELLRREKTFFTKHKTLYNFK
jgi:hypothetical protein